MIELRAQNVIQQEVKGYARDVGNKRWKEAEVYAAINQALNDWRGRVRVPFIYTIPGGWNNGTYEYALPDYVDEPLQPQQKRYVYDWQYMAGIANDVDTWTDIPMFHVKPNSAGGRTLHLDYQIYNGDGRIIFWAENGTLPTTIPLLNAGIDGDDTSLVLATVPNVGRVGYVKIDAEWMQYAGYTEGASTLTLTNLLRGINSTTAGSHSSSAPVHFGVAADHTGLFQQLTDGAMHSMMRYWMMNASSRETNHYEKQLLFYQDQAMRFWPRYSTTRRPQTKLTRDGLGDLGLGYFYQRRSPYA